jgi:hypothetical protein
MRLPWHSGSFTAHHIGLTALHSAEQRIPALDEARQRQHEEAVLSTMTGAGGGGGASKQDEARLSELPLGGASSGSTPRPPPKAGRRAAASGGGPPGRHSSCVPCHHYALFPPPPPLSLRRDAVGAAGVCLLCGWRSATRSLHALLAGVLPATHSYSNYVGSLSWAGAAGNSGGRRGTGAASDHFSNSITLSAVGGDGWAPT